MHQKTQTSTNLLILTISRSSSIQISRARASVSVIVTRRHFNISRNCFLSWSASADARKHALARVSIPLAFAVGGGIFMRRVIMSWRCVIRKYHEVEDLKRHRRRTLMAHAFLGWERVGMERRRRKFRELEIMKECAQHHARKMNVLLMCSYVFALWRHVTNRTSTSRALRNKIMCRHRYLLIFNSFSAWSLQSSSKSRALFLHRERQRDPFHFAVRTPRPKIRVSIMKPMFMEHL